MGGALGFDGEHVAFDVEVDRRRVHSGQIEQARDFPNRAAIAKGLLPLAIRVRELLDQNLPLAAATRIVSLEHQLAAAHRRITHLEQITGQLSGDASDR